MKRALIAAIAATVIVGCGNTTTNVTVVAPPGAVVGLRVFNVPSGTMEPSIAVGEKVFAQPEQEPRVGDIIVFHPSQDAQETAGGGAALCGPQPHVVADGSIACDEPVAVEAKVNFIKRVIAGPGDVISIVEGHVIRNGQRETDSYIKPCVTGDPKCNFPTPIKIPSDHWFTMGDNRGESDDSRFWGPVPTSWIVGVVHGCGSANATCPGT